MSDKFASFLVCFLILFPLSLLGQTPQRLSDPDVSPAVWGVLEKPSAPGPHPGVILLHGASGWRPMYAQYAKSLADSGFITLALDYYSETGPAAVGSEEKLRKWPLWKETVRNAVTFMQASPEVMKNRLGLVGFSRGAFLAVSSASSMPAVKAVVDFYGGGGGGTDPIEQEVQSFPPLIILHGDADEIVPVRFAHTLRDIVASYGGEVEVHIYPGVRHAFHAPDSPTYSEEAAADSFRRIVEFLHRRLMK